MLKTVSFLLLLMFPLLSLADLDQLEDVKNNVFWQSLYNDKYHTLYCAIHKSEKADSVITHVYPLAWMANAMNCPDQNVCNFARYRDATADLHNLWPVEAKMIAMRKHYLFSDGDGSEGRKSDCNFVTFDKGVQPREYAKGEIARSMLYIMWKYRMPDFRQLPLLLQWHNKYAPNSEEKWRNEKIKTLQGNENPFIVTPDLANQFFGKYVNELKNID